MRSEVCLRPIVLMTTVGMLLTGCAGNPPKGQEKYPTKRIAIGWIRHDWRVCIDNDTCPKPSPKTVVLPAPMPAVVTPAEHVETRPTKAETKRLPIIVHFEFAKATPTKNGVAALESALALIRPTDILRIEGHTDDIGGQDYNDRLARKRAEFVAAWLKKRGVKNAMEIEAHGKCCYAVPNDSEAQRALNRRVEVRFSTTTDKE